MEIPTSFSKSLLVALGVVVTLTVFWEWFCKHDVGSETGIIEQANSFINFQF